MSNTILYVHTICKDFSFNHVTQSTSIKIPLMSHLQKERKTHFVSERMLCSKFKNPSIFSNFKGVYSTKLCFTSNLLLKKN